MGNMECVPGMRYYDSKSIIRLYHTFHNSIVYPGEIIPMIFSADAAAAEEFGSSPIGLVFAERTNLRGYGVTCQVVEKRLSQDHKIRSKIRVLQRFKVITQLALYPYTIVLLPHYSTDSPLYYIHVEILPEFQLGPAIPSGTDTCSATNRWANNKSLQHKMKRFRAIAHPWPHFVYNLYDVGRIMMKIQYFSVELGIGRRRCKNKRFVYKLRNYCNYWLCRKHAPESDAVLLLVGPQSAPGRRGPSRYIQVQFRGESHAVD